MHGRLQAAVSAGDEGTTKVLGDELARLYAVSNERYAWLTRESDLLGGSGRCNSSSSMTPARCRSLFLQSKCLPAGRPRLNRHLTLKVKAPTP